MRRGMAAAVVLLLLFCTAAAEGSMIFSSVVLPTKYDTAEEILQDDLSRAAAAAILYAECMREGPKHGRQADWSALEEGAYLGRSRTHVLFAYGAQSGRGTLLIWYNVFTGECEEQVLSSPCFMTAQALEMMCEQVFIVEAEAFREQLLFIWDEIFAFC